MKIFKNVELSVLVRLTASGAMLGVALGWAAPARADWVSPDGDLSLRWLGPLTAENCSVEKPHGNYEVGNLVSGVLYPTSCSPEALQSDAGTYTFVDTAGTKRCVGRMDIFFLDRQRGRPSAEATWYIDGSATDSTCSTAGTIDSTELVWQE